MIVDIIPSLKEITPQKIYGKTVIVLDIFRCTSTIVTALANGGAEVIPAASTEEAIEISSKMPPGTFVMAGEVKGEKISSFEFGNSPMEFTSDKISGKKIILTTTNGTNAIKSCKPAKTILISSFLNAASVTSCAVGYSRDIVIVCAGTRGNIALEDVMGAGFHMAELKKSSEEIRLSELARTFYYLYQYFKEHLNHLLSTTRSGINLKTLGYEADLDYCLKQNQYKIVPYFKQNSVQLLRSIKISGVNN